MQLRVVVASLLLAFDHRYLLVMITLSAAFRLVCTIFTMCFFISHNIIDFICFNLIIADTLLLLGRIITITTYSDNRYWLIKHLLDVNIVVLDCDFRSELGHHMRMSWLWLWRINVLPPMVCSSMLRIFSILAAMFNNIRILLLPLIFIAVVVKLIVLIATTSCWLLQ